MIKAMLIKELLENGYVIGYRFRKMLKQSNIEASNGAIYYHLQNFESLNYVKAVNQGKSKAYHLTTLGKQMLSKHLVLVPKNIEHTMQELGSQIPFIDWTSSNDVKKFHNSVEKLSLLLKNLLEDIA